MKWYLKVLKNYAVFEGRARRKEYWNFILVHILIILFLEWLLLARISAVPYVIYFLATFIPTIGVTIRRLHDVNKSGWFMWIPLYNLILYCTKGTTGPNDYGPDPKNPEFEEFLNEAQPGLPQ